MKAALEYSQFFFGIFGLFAQIQVSLSRPGFEAPYYLHFPPIPYNHLQFNGPGPNPQFLPPWLQQQNFQVGQISQNQTNFNTVRNQPVPTIGTLRLGLTDQNINLNLNNRVNSPPQTLHNGTVLYYVSGPWGGLKSIVPVNRDIGNTINSTPPNWSNPSVATSFGNFNRDQQTQTPSPNSNLPNNNPWSPPQFGWGGWSPYYDGPSLTTQNPTGSITPGTMKREQTSATPNSTTTTTTTQSTTSATPTNVTTTPISSAASNDSVAKFRRIVSQIRELAIKELRT